MSRIAAVFAAVSMLTLATCDDTPQAPGRDGASSLSDPKALVRRAAEEAIVARLRLAPQATFRAVQVYGQQPADAFAVCGQVGLGQGASLVFVPWVAPVTLQQGRAVVSDVFAGVTNAEASRVYIESLDRCFEGGGSHPGRPRQVRALPPLPHDVVGAGRMEAPPAGSPPLPVAGADDVPAQPGPTRPVAAPTSRHDEASGVRQIVTTRAAHPVNIRDAPGGGGVVLRTVPRASQLRVFGEAPGGWLQVGDDEPFGWVHGSMLER